MLSLYVTKLYPSSDIQQAATFNTKPKELIEDSHSTRLWTSIIYYNIIYFDNIMHAIFGLFLNINRLFSFQTIIVFKMI